jgi:type II secretory pathway pseudopilin PulG
MIELMVVMSIVAIVLAIGVPGIFRAMRKEGLRKAEADLVEACSHARAQAILTDTPMELVIRAEDGRIEVRPVQTNGSTNGVGLVHSTEEGPEPRRKSTPKGFTARLADDIAVSLLYVNFKDQMEQPEAKVRFFPNSTSDEFTMIIASREGERKISLEVVTAMADVEVLR